MPRPSNTAERRQQIVDGLRQVLAKRGYEKASVASIAQMAGLTTGLVHYHFPSKQAILLELIEQLYSQVKERECTLLEGGAEPLAAFIDARLALGRGADREAVACWVAIGAEAIRQPEVGLSYATVLDEQKTRLLDLIEAQSQEPESDALALLAAIEGCYQLAAVGELTPPGFAAAAVKRMARGLGLEA